jgi:phosphatidate cytidylyltransferase
MALNLKTLLTRAISAFFFVIVLVSSICFSYYSLVLLFGTVAIIALHEYYNLAKKLNSQPYAAIGYTAAVLLFAFFSIGNFQIFDTFNFEPIKNILVALFFLTPVFILMKALFDKTGNGLLNAQHTLFGLVYAVLPLALLISFPVSHIAGQSTYVYFKVLGIVFLIWSNDTLAYLGGSLFGKHKMFERVSPGKTWEGTVIGAAGTVGVGFLLNLNVTYEQTFIWPCIALIVAVFGTIGDLVESMLKRLAGVKDSGQIMPGHGGALDRFDSLIFVSPFIYFFLKLVGAN